MRILGVCVVLAFSSAAIAGGVTVVKLQGDVQVRHGVTEQWVPIAAGSELKPDDSMRTGAKGSAILLVNQSDTSVPPRKISLPPDVIVDISDVRDLTQEELLLKLTMEKVRASSYEWKNDDLNIPNTGVIHGAERKDSMNPPENSESIGRLQWNGTKVLFANGFYSTGILKALEVFRLYPALGKSFDNRMRVAEAMEQANLRGEALAEYGAIAVLEGITPVEQSTVRTRMDNLRK